MGSIVQTGLLAIRVTNETKKANIEQRSSLASVLEQAEGLSGDAADALGHHAAQFGRRLLADVSHLQFNQPLGVKSGGGAAKHSGSKNLPSHPAVPGLSPSSSLYCLVCEQYCDQTRLVLSNGFHKCAVSGDVQN